MSRASHEGAHIINDGGWLGLKHSRAHLSMHTPSNLIITLGGDSNHISAQVPHNTHSKVNHILIIEEEERVKCGGVNTERAWLAGSIKRSARKLDEASACEESCASNLVAAVECSLVCGHVMLPLYSYFC